MTQKLEIVFKFSEDAMRIEESLHRAGMYNKEIRDCVRHISEHFGDVLEEFVFAGGRSIEAHLKDGSYVRISEVG